MMLMPRASTVTHKFHFHEGPDNFADVLITYAQNERIVKEWHKDDLEWDGNTAIIHMTQEEANLFDSRFYVAAQVRVLWENGECWPSKVFSFSVTDVINDEVME